MRKKMRAVGIGGAIFALSFIVWGSAAGAGEIRDPKALLSQLDQVSARVPFSESFHCGDTAKIRVFHKDCQFGCGEGGCAAVCTEANDEFVRTVGECTGDSVSLIDEDGSS